MKRAIAVLTYLIERLQQEYEVALQVANITEIAYLEGVIDGVERAIKELSDIE